MLSWVKDIKTYIIQILTIGNIWGGLLHSQNPVATLESINKVLVKTECHLTKLKTDWNLSWKIKNLGKIT